jgi:hypothetical protein
MFLFNTYNLRNYYEFLSKNLIRHLLIQIKIINQLEQINIPIFITIQENRKQIKIIK